MPDNLNSTEHFYIIKTYIVQLFIFTEDYGWILI